MRVIAPVPLGSGRRTARLKTMPALRAQTRDTAFDR
ncbi:hypothetical protein BURPS1710b_A1267 [Burkholderia pseudomallei 1710b]|uniref:Uncharacterized protein n=1 Tax=Burkholderia pseudomallei (strain 1710b) TaxID=320372 RepID=Q3JJ29_BURP1|nr:hypothetical protein BURPS1710b_A1267 [Burkholderia pseudomallei 1710b]